MNLSVCLIARDEERNIARALHSVREVADEIVLADTGSRDRTIELAQELGASVYSFPWQDDFSAAYNFAWDHARCDWILCLDADEELLPESRVELRSCLARKDALAFLLLRQDLRGSGIATDFTEMWQPRLFRNRPDLRFRGRCDPGFHPSLESRAAAEGKYVGTSSIRLRHYGYLKDPKGTKLHRAVRLLELELAERPGQLYYLIEYGRTLLLLNDSRGHAVMGEAAAALHRHRLEPSAPQALAAALFEYLLLAPRELSSNPWTAQELEALAERWFPRSPPLLWRRAQIHFQHSDFAGAARLLERLIQLGAKGDYEKAISFEPRILGDEAKLNLAVCQIRLGQLDSAEVWLSQLLPSPIVGAQARQNLQAIRDLRRRSGRSPAKPAGP